jgi:predicted ribosome quality control (RQC) complex YloA/Tae2 family protein
MNTENIFVEGLNREITFHIGKNKKGNFDAIDKGLENDLWFHANGPSSCHVVCNVPDDIEKDELKYIIKKGGFLCKINTSKLKKCQNVEIIYTQIKNITKTKVAGCVITQNTKIIIIK